MRTTDRPGLHFLAHSWALLAPPLWIAIRFLQWRNPVHYPKYPELRSCTLSANNDFRVGDPLHTLLKDNQLTATSSHFQPTSPQVVDAKIPGFRSEERRVGKECRSRWSLNHQKKHNT